MAALERALNELRNTVIASLAASAALLLVLHLLPAEAQVPAPPLSRVDWRWWQDEESPAPTALVAEAAAQGLRCTEQPARYERLLAWSAPSSREDPEAWAARVLGFVDAVLLAPARPPGPGLVRWRDSGAEPLVEDGYVRMDGAFQALGRAPVPAYLFLPLVDAAAPFRARGAVLVLHGHDRGREQVVGYPDKYQKAMAARLAAEGFVVLAADNVSFGRHDPKGDGKGHHDRDWQRYMEPGLANGLISYSLVDLTHAVTLLRHLRVAPDPDAGRYRLARWWEAEALPATSAIGVTGLSFGAELAAFMSLDPRPVAYVVASGLIDLCDVLANDHHRCQLIPPFEGVLTLWDLIVAAAVAERPTFGRGRSRPLVQVQQGGQDIILRGWGRRGLVELRQAARDLRLDNLEVVEWEDAGHEYLLEPALAFWRRAL